MNTLTPLRIAACAVVSLTTLSLAQDPAVRPVTPTTPTQSSPDYCSVSKILGAKVRMNPGAEARREAEKDGDVAKRPEGKIDDVLVDGTNGEMKFAVVSFGGFIGIGDKTVAVPVSALTWVPAHERFDLAASEDRLLALPAFDLDKAKKAGLDEAATTIEGQWQTGNVPVDASGRKGDVTDAMPPKTKETAKHEAKTLEGTKFYLVPARYMAASEIDDFPVYTGSEKFGKVSDVLVDRAQRNVALVVVKRGGALGIGGTEYLVPFRALHFCTSGDEKVHCLDSDARKLETAVLYEKPKEGIVDPEAAKRALGSDTFDKKHKDGMPGKDLDKTNPPHPDKR